MVHREQNGSSSAGGGRRKLSRKPATVSEMLESVVGCKWSMCVLDAIVAGANRPGEMRRVCEGISAKVLNERLRKLMRYGIVTRMVHAEVPPRVEYALTEFGSRFVPLVEAVRQLQATLGEDTRHP
ncbi:MAG: hypothetical protein GMKNLPBB_01406 [Myxococcota bacterium]|nr:hypothetical protein [Myxococcota bacterium]